jgi:hypothetical protein
MGEVIYLDPIRRARRHHYLRPRITEVTGHGTATERDDFIGSAPLPEAA